MRSKSLSAHRNRPTLRCTPVSPQPQIEMPKDNRSHRSVEIPERPGAYWINSQVYVNATRPESGLKVRGLYVVLEHQWNLTQSKANFLINPEDEARLAEIVATYYPRREWRLVEFYRVNMRRELKQEQQKSVKEKVAA